MRLEERSSPESSPAAPVGEEALPPRPVPLRGFTTLARHEVRRLLRAPRTFWLTVLVVVVAAVLTLLVWPRESLSDPSGGRHLFRWFLMAQLGAALLCLPAGTAGVIAGERDAGTWEPLRVVPLPLPLLALAKLAGPVTWIGIMIAAAAPLACALVLLGGLTIADVARGYATTVAALFMSALVGHSISLRSRNTGTAAVRAVLWTGIWTLGLAEALVFVFGARLEPIAACFSPFRVLQHDLGFALRPARGSAVAPPFEAHLVYCALLGSVHLLHSLVVFGSSQERALRSSRAAARAKDPAAPRPPLLSRVVPFRPVAYLESALKNPALRVALRGAPHATRSYRIACFVGLSAIIGVATFQRLAGNPLSGPAALTRLAAGGTVVLIALATPLSSAGALPRERRSGRHAQLAMTRLGSGRVYFAAWFAALCSTVPPLASAVWWLALFLAYGPWIAAAYPALLGVILLWAVFAATLSTFCGAIARRPLTAILTALFAALGGSVILPVMSAIVRATASPNDHGALAAIQPLYVIGVGVNTRWDSVTVDHDLILSHVMAMALATIALYALGADLFERSYGHRR